MGSYSREERLAMHDMRLDSTPSLSSVCGSKSGSPRNGAIVSKQTRFQVYMPFGGKVSRPSQNNLTGRSVACIHTLPCSRDARSLRPKAGRGSLQASSQPKNHVGLHGQRIGDAPILPRNPRLLKSYSHTIH